MWKYFKQKKFFPALTAALAGGLFFLLVRPAQADIVTEAALSVFGTVVGLIVSVVGALLLMVISVLISVAQVNNFIGSPPVVQGWTIVRDICNMFFVLVLLIIAFATILHIQNFSIKQLLKRVIVFAILINFSKMICGLIIDFFQVIMLTFVNAFKDIGGGRFAVLLGIDKLMNIDASRFRAGVDFWSIIGSYVLILIYVIVMLVVMVAFLATLIYRLVMLWIYIILSPLAYLASVVPFMSGLSKTWWTQFTQQVITGPLLAFFIWLSLATLGQFSNSGQGYADWRQSVLGQTTDPKAATIKVDPTLGATEVGTTAHMLRFAISLGLLIGGLIVSKQFGGSAANAMSQVVSKAQSGAGWMKRKGKVLAKKGAAATGRVAWRGTKAVGRGGLQLAKTADWAASKRIAEARARARGEAGFEYKPTQGVLTRAASRVKEGMFTKTGWRRHFEGATRAVGVETNRDFNRRRSAAKVTGEYVDYTGRKYKYNKAIDRYEDQDGRRAAHPVTGEEFGAMKDITAKLQQNLSATKFRVAKDSEKLAKEKTALSELAKPYASYSKDELKSLFAGTINPQQLQGIGYALAEKGGFDNQADVEKVAGLIQDKPERLKAFVDAVAKESPEMVYNPDSAADRKALELKAKKGEVDLSALKFKSFKLDAAGKMNVADMNTGAKLLKVLKDGLGPLRFLAKLDKLKKEGDMEAVSKVAQMSGTAAEQALSRSADLERASGLATDPAVASKLSNDARESYNQSFSWFKDQLNMGKGDIGEFGSVAGKAPDKAMLKKLFAEGSVKDLSAIDADTFNTSLEAQTAAMNMTFKKLDGLYKSGLNPELTRSIAVTMVGNHHNETDKIRDLYNDI